jgi:DNA-binding FrmR family transcriptional regulator
MGSQSFTTYSRGKDVKDAYNRAVEHAEFEYGHQEGYSGAINSSAGCRDITSEFKASKKDLNKFINEQMDKLTKHQGAQAICLEEPKTNSNKIKTQVEHVVTPGTKKWVLTYIVYHGDSRIASAITKGDAVKRARDYSEKNQCTTTIKMERRLEKDSHALVAKITYKKSSDEKEGRWVFFGWASC